MKTPSKLLIALAMLAAGALAAESASAHGGRVRLGVGLHFGPYWGPFWGPAWYYPPPVYYPPAVIVAPPAGPMQYVERDQPLQSGYWYYCETARGYYPYVTECPGGWKAVPPAPPPAK